MTTHDQGPAGDPAPRLPHEPMDRDTCLAVLSLLLDERHVDPELAARAQAYLAAHPEIAEVERDWRAMREALATTPPRRAREGFTERVLAAVAANGTEAPLGTLHFARRLAVAASLALVVTLGWGLMRPASLQADAGMERARHAVDHFRDDPFEADDILGGLRARLRDAGFAARGPAAGDAR
ncbi:MAG: hypothetical protein ACYTG2_09925 [Planctomycetota bacterium]|jgi:hypothetical protein